MGGQFEIIDSASGTLIFVWLLCVAAVLGLPGPLNQATGPPQSDAGVGIGVLIGDRDSLTGK